MTTTINDLQKFTLTVSELNAAEIEVPIFGVPVWASNNDAVVSVLPSSDGLSAVVTSVSLGSGTITVSVDGLTASEDVTVTASPGVKLVLAASAPEPK